MAEKRRGRPRDEAARDRIMQAATAMFLADGYATTTVGGIAAEAGVAVQTVYSAYSSKVGVLSAVHDVAIAGDETTPLLDRDWATGLVELGSISEAWGEAVRHVGRATALVAPIYAVIESASADPDVAQLLATLRDQRREFSAVLAERLLSRPGVGAGVGSRRVADLLYATLSVASYIPLVVECGWSQDQWQDWVQGVGEREFAPQ